MWLTWAFVIGVVALLLVVGRTPRDSWLEVAEKCQNCECEAQSEAACSFFNKMFVDELVTTAWAILLAGDDTGLMWKDTDAWHSEGFAPPTACTDWKDTPVSHLSLLLMCSDWGGRADKVREALDGPAPPPKK